MILVFFCLYLFHPLAREPFLADSEQPQSKIDRRNSASPGQMKGSVGQGVSVLEEELGTMSDSASRSSAGMLLQYPIAYDLIPSTEE